MTECERIIEEGTLPEEFFQEEVRDDFLVDARRKKIWAIELDLLLKFDAVCKEYGLKYFLCGGTLLGAVRHKGFIPWDDDVDVGMFRADYEKLMQLGDAFKEPYFLQTPYTDDGYFFSFAKIRNSNTTGLSKKFAFNRFNQGIFIDVFPFDYSVFSRDEEKFEKINRLNVELSTYMRKNNPFLDERDQERVRNYSGRNPLEACEEIQKLAIAEKGTPTENLSPLVFTMLPYRRNYYFTKDFEETTSLPFEGLKFPAPKGYDKVLRTLYGDYMQFPPVEERGSGHSASLFVPDVSYVNYLNQHIE